MKRFMILLAVAAAFLMTSCERGNDLPYPGATSDRVEAKFKQYFYRDSEVYANKLEGFSATEWAVGSRDGIRPLEVFKDITGMDVSATESYNYGLFHLTDKVLSVLPARLVRETTQNMPR